MLCRTIFGCLRTVRGEPGTPSAARASSVPAWEALPPGPSGVRRRAQPTTIYRALAGAWRAAQRPARGWRALHTPVRARPRPADAHGDAAHGGVAPPGPLRDRAAPTAAWQRPQQRGQQWAAPPKPLGVLRTPPARAGGPAVRRLPTARGAPATAAWAMQTTTSANQSALVSEWSKEKTQMLKVAGSSPTPAPFR